MASRKRRRPTAISLLLIGALSVSGVAALTRYVQTTPGAAKVPDAERRMAEEPSTKGASAIEVPDIKIKPHRESSHSVQVLTPRYDSGDIKFDASSQKVPRGEDAKVVALNAYLDRSRIVPEGARVIGVTVHDGVAQVSFNAKIMGGYGSDDERILVQGFLATLQQFGDVQKAEFLVDGKIVDSFGGHISFEGPQSVRPSESTSSTTPPPQP